MTLPYVLIIVVIAHASYMGLEADVITTVIAKRFRTERACIEARDMVRSAWQNIERVASRGRAKCVKD